MVHQYRLIWRQAITSQLHVFNIYAFILFFACSNHKPSSEDLGTEDKIVKDAIQAIELCKHWHGEEAFSNKRAKQIEAGLKQDCKKAILLAKNAFALYPLNSQLSAGLIQLIDLGHLSVSDGEKTTICEGALSKYAEKYQQNNIKDIAFSEICPAQASRIYKK